MKIAVYTIALNEEKFVKTWAESAKDADYLLIADTGSTDGTAEAARSMGVNVVDLTISPWRFDDARNASLAVVPADIDFCIALDMDEVLIGGWRDHLERIAPNTTRPRYTYVWSWLENGSPGLVYGGDKIHSRRGYRWRQAVHETLVSTLPEHQEWIGLEINHHPDSTKSRGQYFPLLEVARAEAPHDDRTAFYYARELYFHQRHEQAREEFHRYLNLPTARWAPERAAAMRFIAKTGYEPMRWYTLATLESPDRREPWVDLAQYLHDIKDWEGSLLAANRALSIKEKALEYLCEAEAWGSRPHDLASIALWNLGRREEALVRCREAIEFEPNNPRLLGNLEMMSGTA